MKMLLLEASRLPNPREYNENVTFKASKAPVHTMKMLFSDAPDLQNHCICNENAAFPASKAPEAL